MHDSANASCSRLNSVGIFGLLCRTELANMASALVLVCVWVVLCSCAVDILIICVVETVIVNKTMIVIMRIGEPTPSARHGLANRQLVSIVETIVVAIVGYTFFISVITIMVLRNITKVTGKVLECEFRVSMSVISGTLSMVTT